MFEGQGSEKRSEHSFCPDHHDAVVHHCGDWEPPLQIHSPNPRSRSAADATPASSNLAVFVFISVLVGDEKIKVMRSFKKKKNSKLNKCRKVIFFVTPTICMCVYVCHHRSPKRLLNQTVVKGKPVPGFHHNDGPGNAFISPQIYHWENPLALILW